MTERDQEEQRGPDQEPRTGGVALVEHHTLSIDGRPRYFTAAGGETPTHIAFPLAEAEARNRALAEAREETRVARQEGARACVAGFGFKRERDEARVQAESLIDPNDQAVRDRLYEAMRRFGHLADRDYATDAVLAALRGAK
jgi:hypothetical protein